MTEALACPLHISNSPPCTDTALRSRRGFRARFAWKRRVLLIRGRRECRVRAAPAVSRAKLQKKRTRAYRFSGGNPAFPAQWFYGVLRALPGDQACLTPSSALLIADLTPASGRQNDTTWPYASAPSSKAPTASTASRPTLMTLANAPLKGRDNDGYGSDLGPPSSEISENRKLMGSRKLRDGPPAG